VKKEKEGERQGGGKMSRGNKGKTLNLKGSHLSAAPPF